MDAFLAQDIKDNRKATLEGKLQTALELMSLGIEIKREQIRRDHPNMPDEEIEQQLVQWLVFYD